MFIYIGNDHVVESDSIIAILDYELIYSSKRLNEVLDRHREIDQIFGTEEAAKSIIITLDSIYYSPFSTYTLKNRDELYEAY